jgi:hypothetical protein
MAYQTNDALVESFINGADDGHNYPPEAGRDPTLEIVKLPDGTTALVSYGWQKLAERDPHTGEVTIFGAWESWAWEQFTGSRGEPTTARHLRLVREGVAEEPVGVEEVSRRPKVAATPDKVRAIGHYVGAFANHS